MSDVPRGKYIGRSVESVASEAEHFMRCESCGGWMDCRGLGSVFDHEGPLPHPACDAVQ